MKNRILALAIISALTTGCAVDTTNHTTHLEPITPGISSIIHNDRELADLSRDLAGTGVQALNLGPITSLIIPKGITFDKSSYDVDKKFIPVLRNVATALNKHKESKIRISGFAASNEGNHKQIQQISEERGIAVAMFLISENVDVSRIEIKGFGDQYPVNDKKRKGSRQDRRISIALVNDNG